MVRRTTNYRSSALSKYREQVIYYLSFSFQPRRVILNSAQEQFIHECRIKGMSVAKCAEFIINQNEARDEGNG